VDILRKLRNRFNLFCYQNRDKGIPNLMLYIALGNAIVLIMSMINGGSALYSLLCFDKAAILQGQVWRLVTYVFTQSSSGFLGLIFLYFFYMLGRHVELSMGTLKFNLYYFSGVILMDIFAMIFANPYFAPLYWGMAYYLHLSLILTYATTNPDAQFMIFFIIPVKAWALAAVYLILVLIDIFNLSYPIMYFPHNLFPLVALGNYLLFIGSDIVNLLPLSWRAKLHRKRQQAKPSAVQKTGSIPFRQPPQKADYLHRCTVCGRTDQTNPELEFRYCSRCTGYHCYCEDHISNHDHITE
jgi:hypothetical protein